MNDPNRIFYDGFHVTGLKVRGNAPHFFYNPELVYQSGGSEGHRQSVIWRKLHTPVSFKAVGGSPLIQSCSSEFGLRSVTIVISMAVYNSAVSLIYFRPKVKIGILKYYTDILKSCILGLLDI